MCALWEWFKRLQVVLQWIHPRTACLLASLFLFALSTRYWAEFGTLGSSWLATPRIFLFFALLLLILARYVPDVGKTGKKKAGTGVRSWHGFAAVGILGGGLVLWFGAHPGFFLYVVASLLAGMKVPGPPRAESTAVSMFVVAWCLFPGDLDAQASPDPGFWQGVRHSDAMFNEMIGRWVAGRTPPFLPDYTMTYHRELELYRHSGAEVFPVHPSTERIGIADPGHPIGVLVTSQVYDGTREPYVFERVVVLAFRATGDEVQVQCHLYPTRELVCRGTLDPDTGEISAFSSHLLWDQLRERTEGTSSRACTQDRFRGYAEGCERYVSMCGINALMRAYDECRGVGEAE